MRRRLAIASFVGFFVSLASCGGGDATGNGPVNGEMHATIVGSVDPWDAEKSLTAKLTNGKLVITGVEQSTVAITLTIYDAEVGAFTAIAGEQLPRIEATYSDNRTFSYSSSKTGGTTNITITELSATKAVGTFSFVAPAVAIDAQGTDQYRISNGTFDVRIR